MNGRDAALHTGHGQAGFTPGRKPSDHEGNLLIAQLLQGLPRQGRTAIQTSMQKDGGAFVGDRIMNTKLQQPPR